MEYYAAVQKKEAALNHESLWTKSHHARSKRSCKMQNTEAATDPVKYLYVHRLSAGGYARNRTMAAARKGS